MLRLLSASLVVKVGRAIHMNL